MSVGPTEMKSSHPPSYCLPSSRGPWPLLWLRLSECAASIGQTCRIRSRLLSLSSLKYFSATCDQSKAHTLTHMNSYPRGCSSTIVTLSGGNPALRRQIKSQYSNSVMHRHSHTHTHPRIQDQQSDKSKCLPSCESIIRVCVCVSVIVYCCRCV